MRRFIMRRLKLISKVFPNSVGGFLQASGYAKDNGMKLRTTEEEFAKNNQRYGEAGKFPEYYMFVFETYEDYDI